MFFGLWPKVKEQIDTRSTILLYARLK